MHYHFDDDLPRSEHDVFLKAVKAVYDATGIVKLVAGQGKKSDNQVTFPVIKKCQQRVWLNGDSVLATLNWCTETYGSQVTVINYIRQSESFLSFTIGQL